MHLIEAVDFDGMHSWHDFLFHNTERYLGYLAGHGYLLAKGAVKQLESNLPQFPNSNEAVTVHFDLRPVNILVENGVIICVIDFESMRGGHASMDFFKLWDEVWRVKPELMLPMLSSYGSFLSGVEDWLYLMK